MKKIFTTLMCLLACAITAQAQRGGNDWMTENSDAQRTATIKAESSGQRMLLLELSRQLKVQSVTDEANRPLVFFQNEEMSRKEVSDRGNDSLLIVLSEPMRAGQLLKLTLRYRGTVISDAGNGILFVGDRGIWYPHVGGSDQFASYDLKFRWPRRLELVERVFFQLFDSC